MPDRARSRGRSQGWRLLGSYYSRQLRAALYPIPSNQRGAARKPFYGTMKTADVPHSRNGKHKNLVGEILADLDQLREGSAMKIPLADLGDTKERVRAALNRATRKAKRVVATASDDLYLYVWTK